MIKIVMEQTITVLTVAILASTINILRVIMGAAKTLPGQTYLAVGHFYLDYFEYLQQMAQGARGRWLVANQFATDDPSQTLIGWGQYLLYGKIGRFFHLSLPMTYWLTIFILTIIAVILIYKLIEKLLAGKPFYFKLSALFLSLLAAPFAKIASAGGSFKIVPYDFWYAPISFFHRFGGIPHHLISSIFSILIILFASQLLTKAKIRYALTVALLLIFLLTFAPLYAVDLISAIALVGGIKLVQLYLASPKKLPPAAFKLLFILFGLGLVVFIAALHIRQVHLVTKVFEGTSAWEVEQQSHPPLSLIFLATGPILFFACLGIKKYFSSASINRLLMFSFIAFGYLYFATPLAVYFRTFNLRFVSPLAYVLFGVLGVLGIEELAQFFSRGKRIIFGSLVSVLGLYFLIVTANIYQSMGEVDSLSYMPRGVMEAMAYLDKQSDKKAILTSPAKSLGVIVPVFADHKVYLGRMMFTPNFEVKQALAEQFYQGQLGAEEAEQLLRKNGVGYVFLTIFEGYPAGNLNKYGFLKEVFKNEAATVYQVKKSVDNN